jgi:hypothetical protein
MRGLLIETARKIVRGLHHAPVIGRILHALAKEREHAVVMSIEDNLRRSGFETLRYGPFKGLKFPKVSHYGYTSMPMKFLGIYERQLQEPVEASMHRDVDLVLNIGAADGYYACGYAYRLKNAKVIAWEMVPFVADLLKELASANGLSDRVEVRGLCTSDELKSISNNNHTLVLSDCEGAEVDLITHENLAHLKSYDMIVECHDHFAPNATEIIRKRFADTHDLQVIESPSFMLNDVPAEGIAAAGGPSLELYRALEENRLYSMRWIIALDKRKR